eukprot:3304767-Alexandrium_andersonii.AAC.1
MPTQDRPQKEHVVTAVNQYEPGGYAKVRSVAAARAGSPISGPRTCLPAWVLLAKVTGGNAEGIM